ncbi:MAG: DegV family protein [Lachnospiraceae bacterium]|nr:DegV family protein [Lachnospiraceae bacterium]
MGKIAVMTDSNSGITQQEGKELGIHVLPMPFYINGKEYFEDITLTQDQFYEALKNDADIKTSQPTPGCVMDFWDDLLEEYDQIVYIPMSSGLSGSCQSAMMLSEDYDRKVQVVNNQRISVTQRQSALDALQLAAKGLDAVQIKEILEREKFRSSIYIMLDTLTYLKKGGRITPAAAAIGTMLRLKPVLTIQGEKLDAFAKARTSSQGRDMMIAAIKKDMEERFGGVDPSKIYLEMAYTYDLATAEDFEKQVQEAFPGFEIVMNPLSLSVSCHIGPGALAVACSCVPGELL